MAIVYWSGTGNTAAMAEAVAEGVTENGAQAQIIPASDFGASAMADYDAIAFGCPAMGAEVLEESEFEPMFMECEVSLSGKKIALFGSYGWGDGEWMRDWESRCQAADAVFACDYVICNDSPDDEGIKACKALGAALV